MTPRQLLATLLFTAACAGACSSASAERVAGPLPPPPRTALAIAPERTRAPYDVQVVGDDGAAAPTYQLRDRYYVLGGAGDRYAIRVTNPTARRVEAVVTVDGLDVVDGEAGDLRKRGYIVPPYGEVRIEGFRTSTEDVATFRFSSVGGSYAAQKGKARNVGVIAVAIFEEHAPPPDLEIVGGGAAPPPYDYRRDLAPPPPPAPSGAGAARKASAPSTAREEAAAPRGPAPAAASAPSVGGRASGLADAAGEAYGGDAPTGAYDGAARARAGLGTEFGEARYSAVTFTSFVRAPGRPVAVAELRYNDAAGLVALGIPVAPQPDATELTTRETADPFPGDVHFARPAR